jgi:hypothetical protein
MAARFLTRLRADMKTSHWIILAVVAGGIYWFFIRTPAVAAPAVSGS